MAEAAEEIRESPVPLKERHLLAALEALRELNVEDLLSAIGTREIARRAGGSPASIFHHYGSLEGLAQAVIATVYDPGAAPVEQITGGLSEITDSKLPADTAYEMHASEFRRITGDPHFRLRMGLWAIGGEPARQAYGEYLRVIDDRLVNFVRSLFDSWGRELRPPFDLRRFVASQVALVNGSSVRYLVDPKASDVRYFARAATALSMVLLRVAGDSHDLDDRLTEMNYYPLRDRRAGGLVGERGKMSRARILHAAAELFGSRGYEDTTVSNIAQAAGVGPSTVHEHFVSKAGIADALFKHQAADLLDSLPDPLTASPDPLRAYLETVAAFVGERRDYAGPYLAALVCHSPTLSDDPLRTGLRNLLEELPHRIPDGADRDELALLLLSAVASRTLAAPGAGHPANVEGVLRLVALREGAVSSPPAT